MDFSEFKELLQLDVEKIIVKVNYKLRDDLELFKDPILDKTISDIGREVFTHEHNSLKSGEMREIVIEETVNFVLISPESFDIREYIRLSKETSDSTKNKIEFTKPKNILEYNSSVHLSEQFFTLIETSRYNITGSNNKISFIEQINKDKELYSDQIDIYLNPGLYSKEQLFEEISELMSISSKNNNAYITILNTISSKTHIVALSEKLSEYSEGTNAYIREIISTTGPGCPFKLLIADPLGTVNASAFSINQSINNKFKLNTNDVIKVIIYSDGNIISEFDISKTELKTPIKLKDNLLESFTSLDFVFYPEDTVLDFIYSVSVSNK
jgi:hypothetical protein